MANRRDRDILKGYFKKGKVPTEEQFAELIDSVHNIVEDGRTVSTADGWEFYPAKDGRMGIRLHTEDNGKAGHATPAWSFAVSKDGNTIALLNAKEETVVEIDQDMTVRPGDRLNFGNSGDTGAGDGYKEAEADKKWVNIVEVQPDDSISRIYSVTCLYRDATSGAYSLTHATAVCIGSTEQAIMSGRRHWWGWSGKTRLRWVEQDGMICLQVRSRRRSAMGKITCRAVETFSGRE